MGKSTSKYQLHMNTSSKTENSESCISTLQFIRFYIFQITRMLDSFHSTHTPLGRRKALHFFKNWEIHVPHLRVGSAINPIFHSNLRNSTGCLKLRPLCSKARGQMSRNRSNFDIYLLKDSCRRRSFLTPCFPEKTVTSYDWQLRVKATTSVTREGHVTSDIPPILYRS